MNDPTVVLPLNEIQIADLRRHLECGLPLVSQPYHWLAEQIQADVKAVKSTIVEMQHEGLIKRFGAVVNHPKLGYVANGMVVWDVPDDKVDDIGSIFASEPVVTLCYQRPRRLPQWPYNLFCMIHGKSREWVEEQLQLIVDRHQLSHLPHRILFSTKQYKQTGGRYAGKIPLSSGESRAQ